MTMSLLVSTQMSYHFALLDYGLPLILGNMFIFLIAGHEVGLAFCSGFMVAKTFPYRPRPIHFASHLACWRSFRMNKSGCINTSKV